MIHGTQITDIWLDELNDIMAMTFTPTLSTRHFMLPPTPVPPTASFQFPKPISYNFRVLEKTKNGKVVSVGLQVQKVEHDEYGAPVTHFNWEDVPRIQEEES